MAKKFFNYGVDLQYMNLHDSTQKILVTDPKEVILQSSQHLY